MIKAPHLISGVRPNARRSAIAATMVILIGGCASTPDATIRYYHAKATTVVTINQTVDCSADKTQLFVMNSGALATTYSADPAKGFGELHIKKLSGTFSDGDFTIGWFDDGRLKSINQSTTGQGETIVKSALTLVAALGVVGGAAPATQALPECDFVAKSGGGKPVSLTYVAETSFAAGDYGKSIPLVALPINQPLYGQLKNKLPPMQARLTHDPAINQTKAVAEMKCEASYDGLCVDLFLNERVAIDVVSLGSSIFKGVVSVPTGTAYKLPIPSAAFFGKQTFSLVLAESGSVSSVSYGKTSGAAGALNSLSAIDTAASPQGDAARAAALKSEADVIVQQQRVARCQAQPDKCQ